MAHDTLRKFGYPETLIREGRHWALLVRPSQVTLGSLVLCAPGEAPSYADLSEEAFVEQRMMVGLAERILAEAVHYDRINYLMLMMVDPHVHFHIIPRYDGEREFDGAIFRDSGWPGPPELKQTQPATAALIERLRNLAAEK